MISEGNTWNSAKNRLIDSIRELGFPAELGEEIAKNLGSPKAMERMIAYLQYVKPRSAELVVDEMLAIKSDIDAWHRKKESEEANYYYTQYLNEDLNE